MRRFISWTGLLLVVPAWLALPAIALADDCSDWTPGEVISCPDYAFWKTLGLLAGAMLSAGAWLANRWNRGSGDDSKGPPPKPPRHFNTRREFDEWAEETDYDGPPPPYLTPGGVPPVNAPPTPPGF